MSAISLTSIPLSTSNPKPVTSWQTYVKERQPEIQQLDQDLKSGDLAAAQQDYNNLEALGRNVIHKDNPFLRADRGQDFNAIGGALENGDLAGAQKAVAALESTFDRQKLPPDATSATVAGSSVNVIA